MDMQGRRRLVTRIPGHLTIYDIARDGRLLLRTDECYRAFSESRQEKPQSASLSCLDSSTVSGISYDGRAIIATILGEGGGPRGSVYLRKTDGSPPIRLGDGAAWASSPDGKWVSSYRANAGGRRRYVLLPTGAGEEREISIPQLKGINLVLGWAADPESLIVRGPGAQDRWQNYLWNSGTGKLQPFGPEGIADMETLVSPDRRQVVAVGPDGKWWTFAVDGAEAAPVKGLTPQDLPLGFRADSRSLFIGTSPYDHLALSIWNLDLATGGRTPWKTLRTARPVEQVSNPVITPDGRAYAYNYLVKTSELYVADGIR